MNLIVENIKNGFISTIDSIKWLETPTKNFVRDKVTKIETFVGYPDWIGDTGKVESYYRNVSDKLC